MITRTVRGLGALAVLTAALVGWPAALLALAGTVAKWLPDLSDPAGLLSRPDAGGLFLLIVLALGWIAWAVWATSLLVEAAAQFRGVPTPRLGGLFPQQAAAALVTAIAVAFASAPTAALAAPPTSPAPAATAIRASSTSVPTNEEAPSTAADQHRDYTVAPGDTLWEIADEELDDPYRWSEIADASHAIAQPDGRHLDDPRLIRPGWTLNIPTTAEAADDPAVELDPQAPAPAAEDDEATITLPFTPLQAPAPAPAASQDAGDSEPGAPKTAPAPATTSPSVIDVPRGEQEDSATAGDEGITITLPPTPLRPPEPALAGQDSDAAPTGLPSTPMPAGAAAMAIDDEGRAGPIHGVLGLPDWITDPLIPSRPEDAPDLVAAVDTGVC